jgi:hypothetical protein
MQNADVLIERKLRGVFIVNQAYEIAVDFPGTRLFRRFAEMLCVLPNYDRIMIVSFQRYCLGGNLAQ